MGPFLEQDPVEPFDFAVGLGPVGAGAFVGDAGLVEDGPPEAGSVAGAVVGEDSFDADAVLGEERVGSMPERCCAGALFVGEDLGVHHSGAVVDGGVQEPVADVGVCRAWGLSSAVDPPAAAVGDPCELLDVDVDEFAGPVPLVAPNRFAVGGPVAAVEPAQSLGAQDVLHR